MVKEITPSRLAAKSVNVAVQINNEAIKAASEALAATVTLRHPNMNDLIEQEQLVEGFEYALNVVLVVDSGAKPVHDPVPMFLDDFVHTMNGEYRGVRIVVEPLEPVERPSFYDDFLNIMASAGVSMGRPRRVDRFDKSDVMLVGFRDIDGEEALVGVNDRQACFEDLLIRAMITVSEAEQDKLERIIGHMDMMYCSRKRLVRDWSTTAITEIVRD